MAVLAASICTHGGKALVSRQFRDLSKDRITALLANFPLLLSNSGTQNTTVEDDAVRYVYQPLEEYYVVLLTNKQSNILQDIDTLHLFVSVVSNMLRSVDEKEIFASAFEILSAFDEIVTLGYKEKLTMLQVQTFLEMDSHEEKIQEIIERNKELEATEERRRRAKEIQRKELARKNMEHQQAAFLPAQNFGYTAAQATPAYDRVETDASSPAYSAPAAPAPRVVPGRGLQLGKKPARVTQAELSQPLLTTKTYQAPAQVAAPAAAPAAPPAPANVVSASASPAPVGAGKPFNNGILVTLNEKVSAQLSREGEVTGAEIKGDLQLRISDASLAHLRILLDVGSTPGVQFKTHPNVDRGLFTSANTIALKDKSKSFPSNDQSLGVLRWRVAAASDTLVPLLFTAWVSQENGIATVVLEYEVTQGYINAHSTQETFDNVRILVPLALDEVELTEDSTGGQVSYDITEEGVVFTVAQIALGDAQQSFEFHIPAESEDQLFPMEVSFDVLRTEGATEADTAFANVRVVDVVTNDDAEQSLPFDLTFSLVSEGYTVN